MSGWEKGLGIQKRKRRKRRKKRRRRRGILPWCMHAYAHGHSFIHPTHPPTHPPHTEYFSASFFKQFWR